MVVGRKSYKCIKILFHHLLNDLLLQSSYFLICSIGFYIFIYMYESLKIKFVYKCKSIEMSYERNNQ